MPASSPPPRLVVKVQRGRARRAAWPRTLVAVGLAAAALAGGLLAFAVVTQPPLPLERVEGARRALEHARTTVSDAKDPDLALAVRRAGELELELARARGALLRSDRVASLNRLAGEVEAACDRALARHAEAESVRLAEAARLFSDLSVRLDGLTAVLAASPGDRRLRRHHLRARLGLAAARSALDAGDPAAAETGLAAASLSLEQLAGQVDRTTARLLDPGLLRRWQRWVDQTLAETAGGGTAVIVEKVSGKCVLVRGRRVVASFAAELGRGGLAGKLHAGDGATPEGRYRVVEKRVPPRTIYHRALLLDYPNADDHHAYAAARRRGLVPRGRGIGGLIEIHGEGGRGVNWTDGCVALANPDMDRLFAAVGLGTPVTIVGQARIPGLAAESAVGRINGREGSRSK